MRSYSPDGRKGRRGDVLGRFDGGVVPIWLTPSRPTPDLDRYSQPAIIFAYLCSVRVTTLCMRWDLTRHARYGYFIHLSTLHLWCHEGLRRQVERTRNYKYRDELKSNLLRVPLSISSSP